MPLTATTPADTSNTVQLDLSSYIDPIARGRTKGTGLAIYKVHYSVSSSSEGSKPDVMTQAGSFRGGLVAGAGLGTQVSADLSGTANSVTANNALAVMGFDYYGPESVVANASVPGPLNKTFLEPSKEVPYVVVRDNVCAVSTISQALTTTSYVSFRLECAQVKLDQATLNQLLRTQTV